ncbi:MAG TPA: TetR/AcrR family transcriptional regulator [Polyangiaceae bacterium]|jgi:AcrR family transcriptional regulator|nr:TetR/AcrR family transcriptional regulator [Polyangiaceae bacterium]
MLKDKSSQVTLRAEHLAQTRHRLLEAAIDVLCEEGPAELSLRTVAKVARVSAPTAYRHFPTTEDLLRAVLDEFDRRVDFGEYPQTVEEFLTALPRIHGGFAREERSMMAYVRARAAAPLREKGRQRRARAVTEVLARALPRWTDAERLGLTAAFQVFVSSATWELWRNVWGVQGEVAGELAAWAVSTLVREAEKRPDVVRALGVKLAAAAAGAQPITKKSDNGILKPSKRKANA